MTTYVLRWDYIDAFKRSCPCHGLPADLDSIAATFDARGDLVELEAFAVDGGGTRPLDTHDFDGPALLALVSDAKEHGDPIG